jgi:hypothetical protein
MSINGAINTLNKFQNALNESNPLSPDQQDQFKSDGFLLPSTFAADGNGLPSSKVTPNRSYQIKRNIITWFVPEFGTIRMYINPQSIIYTNKKIIDKKRTKGGYTLQYWGEDLGELSITGTTGSAGIEGINVLYEIYRAEQYAFDGMGLALAANNANQPNLLSGLSGLSGSSSGSLVGGAAGMVGSLLGFDSSSTSMNNINSLAQMAFSVEMYYNGAVYRGYFTQMTVTERAENFALDYSMNFVVTQRRGYRLNYQPWHRSAGGPSQYDSVHSFLIDPKEIAAIETQQRAVANQFTSILVAAAKNK